MAALALFHKERNKPLQEIAVLRDRATVAQKWAGRSADWKDAFTWGESLYNLAVILNRQNKLSEAEKAYREAIRVLEPLAARHPQDAASRQYLGGSQCNLAMLLYARGEEGQALPLLEQAIQSGAAATRLAPGNESMRLFSRIQHALFAECLANAPDSHRDAGRAIELATTALELDPNSGAAHRSLGMAHYRAGNLLAAIAAIEKGLELDKGNKYQPKAYFVLSMAYRQLGDVAMEHRQFGDVTRSYLYYLSAVQWLEKHQYSDAYHRRLWDEAAARLGIRAAPAGRSLEPPHPAAPGRRE
jgi:tetratricopeptide (TPR) repeat protein